MGVACTDHLITIPTMTLEGGFGTKLQFDRVFFIVDRTRLKDEKDELKNAIVVYIPEKDLSKVHQC